MAGEKKRRKLRQPETVREIVDASSKQEKKNPSRVGGFFKKIFRPIAFIFRPLRWLARHIIPRYFRNSWAELKLVTWPSQKQTRQLTTAVILFAIVLGFVVTLVDFGLDKVFKKVILKQ